MMFIFIEYSDNYLKTSGSLWLYYRYEPHDDTANSESLTSKMRIAGKKPTVANTKDVEIAVPLKYQRNFWRTLKMPLINCEANLILTLSAVTDTKHYILVVALSTQIMQNFYKNWNQILKEQLTGIRMILKQQHKYKTNI